MLAYVALEGEVSVTRTPSDIPYAGLGLTLKPSLFLGVYS